MRRALPLLLLASCHAGTGDSGPVDTDALDDPVRAVGPIYGVQPSEFAPYSRELHANLNRAAPLHVVATDGTTERVYDLPAAESHTVPLVALYAERTWAVTLSSGDVALGTIAFTTDPLPTPFPNVTVRTSAPERASPGLTLMPLQGGPTPVRYLAAFDARGEVAWLYADPDQGFQEIGQRGDNLFVQRDDSVLLEMDWLGNTIRYWSGRDDFDQEHVALEPVRLHHEAFQTPSGTFALMEAGSTVAPRYPDVETGTPSYSPTPIQTDTMFEVDPDTGATLGSWSIADLLDTSRIGYEATFDAELGKDWSHANAIARDEARDLWIVSVRQQDAVIAIDGDGELAWILGDPSGWSVPWADRLLTPSEGLIWPYHQHGLKWDDGRMLLFDNHNYGTVPFSGVAPEWPDTLISRVVEYTVEPDSMTVDTTWSWSPEPRVFSNSLGDSDWLANGDVLAVFGDVRTEDGRLNVSYGRGVATSRVIEFDPVSGETVLDLDLWAADTDAESMWRVYRAARVADPR